jgi:hypothetical protein
MDKRAPLRQHYATKENQDKLDTQHKERLVQIDGIQRNMVTAIGALIQFLDGKTTKTEVVNQLKSISTPDVDRVVVAISKLDKDILSNKLDLKPVTDALNGMKRELGLIPKSLPKIPEQKDTLKVSNLAEVKLDTTSLEKAVKGLKLNPTIDVKAPIINVDAPNLKPLQDLLLDVVNAINNKEVPKFPKIPETDLKGVETRIDKSNKLLKEIVDKRTGGGGGASGSTFADATGASKYAAVVPAIADPTKYGVVVVNADGSSLAGGSGGDLHTALKGATAAGYPTSTAASADRQPLDVTLRDTAGAPVAVGGGTQYTEDAPAAADPTGTVPILVRKDTPATIVSADGDNIAQRATNYGAAYTQIVTSAGAFVDTFGGGTQYADGAVRGTATGTIAMGDDGTNIQSIKTDTSGVLAIQDNGGSITVDGTFFQATQPVSAASLPLPTGAATSALQTQPGVDIGDVTVNNTQGGTEDVINVSNTINTIPAGQYNSTPPTLTSTRYNNLQLNSKGSLRTVMSDGAGNNRSANVTAANELNVLDSNSAAILTSTQLLDDTVATLGTTTYTEATTKGNIIGAVRRDANTTLVDTTNEVAPLQVNSTGELKVAQIQALPTGANVIGALTANQSVNVAQLGANTVATGNGASSTGVLRVAQVNDGTGVIATVSSVTQNADVRQATASNLNAQVVGTIAHDGVDSGNPVKIGGKARTTNPTAVADLDRVDATYDDIGRQVVVLNQVRDLEVHQTTTITASTAETTILTAAAAGVFHDITLITIANTSATATRVDIRDATAGSVIWSMYVPAGQQIGANITVPVKQTTAANNWTATCITSLTDLRLFVQGVKNV